MLRISKDTNRIVSINISTKEQVPDNYTPPEIDSFIIIPGVTSYNHIYQKDNWLILMQMIVTSVFDLTQYQMLKGFLFNL